MILVSPEKIKAYVEQGWWTEETMGELFIKTTELQAQDMAVVDPPNRRSISGDDPQSAFLVRPNHKPDIECHK